MKREQKRTHHSKRMVRGMVSEVGYVTITLAQEGNKFEAGIETREFEHWVKTFVKESK